MLLLAPCLALLETEEEKQSFSVFFERYHRLVLKKARDVVKTQEAAEDVGQEVFLYAAEHFKKFQDRRPDEILHYLILCTASRASNYLKQDKRPEEPDVYKRQYHNCSTPLDNKRWRCFLLCI